jgi:SET domain-containing protein
MNTKEGNMNSYVEVRTSQLHGNGVFAKQEIPKGTKIIQYIGNKITKEEGSKKEQQSMELLKTNADAPRTYIFELNEHYDLDGDIPNNDAKFINHSCDPNCEVDIINDEIWIFAIKDIHKGEELSFNYGFEFDENFREHPCFCGTKNCVGYIISEDDMPKLKEKLKELMA